MSIIKKIFSFDTDSVPSGFGSFFGLSGNSRSVATPSNSLTLSAFFNGVDQLSKDIAKMPKSVYRKQNDKREKLTSHPANYLISVAPNELMTAFDFWRVIVLYMILKGEAIVKIHRHSYTGKEEFFEILDSEEVDVKKSGFTLVYTHKGETMSSADVLHFKFFTLTGIRGISLIKFAAHNLGYQLDAQDYAADVYSNRGLSYGVLESDKEVTNDNKKLIVEGFKSRMNEKGAVKVAALDFGLKYKSISITPAEAQFLESGKFSIEDVARWLNMPVHKLKSLQDANFSTLEQQNIQYVVDCLMGWVLNLENELNRKLFPKESEYDDYVKFSEKGFLRGDSKSQAERYVQLIYSGVMSRNEVRALEDLNPVEGLDDYLTPVNYELLQHMMKMNQKEEKADE